MSETCPWQGRTATSVKNVIRRRPLATYFGLVFAISWVGSFVAAGPKFLRGEALQDTDLLLMFVPMILGPSVAGVVLTAIVDGRSGLRDLFARMLRWRVGVRWYAAALLTAPVGVLAVLVVLRGLVGPVFAPRLFLMGAAIGLVAGFLEEIGWTGYAYPRMQLRRSAFAAAILLGLLHAAWHLAADYLGASRERGVYWLPHFLAMMVAAMTAMRVLIVWVYCHTQSVLLAQLMHAGSTGALAVFVPPRALSASHDTLFYAVYAAVLWLVVAVVVAKCGSRLVRRTE